MSSILVLIAKLINLYVMVVFVRVLMSWFQPNRYNPIVNFIYRITDPLMDAVRRAFPFLATGGFDLSPIVIIFLLHATQRYLMLLAFKFSGGG